MRRLAALLSLFLALPAAAAEVYLGTIAGATTSTHKTQASTATPFTIPTGSKLTIQCDQDAYIAIGISSVAATSANGLKVLADTIFPTSLGDYQASGANVQQTTISVLGVTATAACKVFLRVGTE